MNKFKPEVGSPKLPKTPAIPKPRAKKISLSPASAARISAKVESLLPAKGK